MSLHTRVRASSQKRFSHTKRAEEREREMSGNDKTTAMDFSFKQKEREQTLKMAGQPLKAKRDHTTAVR